MSGIEPKHIIIYLVMVLMYWAVAMAVIIASNFDDGVIVVSAAFSVPIFLYPIFVEFAGADIGIDIDIVEDE